jgi:hypothetical protein
MDENAGVLLDFILMMQTCSLAVQIEPKIFWKIPLV